VVVLGDDPVDGERLVDDLGVGAAHRRDQLDQGTPGHDAERLGVGLPGHDRDIDQRQVDVPEN
jgi:hypothetical protein